MECESVLSPWSAVAPATAVELNKEAASRRGRSPVILNAVKNPRILVFIQMPGSFALLRMTAEEAQDERVSRSVVLLSDNIH